MIINPCPINLSQLVADLEALSLAIGIDTAAKRLGTVRSTIENLQDGVWATHCTHYGYLCYCPRTFKQSRYSQKAVLQRLNMRLPELVAFYVPPPPDPISYNELVSRVQNHIDIHGIEATAERAHVNIPDLDSSLDGEWCHQCPHAEACYCLPSFAPKSAPYGDTWEKIENKAWPVLT